MISIDVFGLYVSVLIGWVAIIASYHLLITNRLRIGIFSVILMLFVSILMVYNNLYISSPTRNVLAYVMVSLTLGILFKEDIKQALLKYFAIWVLIAFYETLIAILFSLFGIINESLDVYNLNIIKTIVTILVLFAVYSTIKIPPVRRGLTKIVNFVYKNYGDYFVIGIIILTSSLLSTYQLFDLNNSNANMVVLAISILILILIIYFIRSKDRETNLELKNKFLENSNAIYNKISEEYEIFKHNKNNQLLTLRSLANKETKALIDEMLDNTKNSKSYFLPMFKNAPIGIKDILFVKFSDLDIKNLKINFSNECEEGITKKLSPKNYSAFLEALGIVVDNSIEAIKDCDEKIVYINIEVKAGLLLFNITNTFSSELDLEKLSEKYYTTKRKGTGIGIYSIKMNRRVKYKNSILNNKFKVIISTKIKN